MKMALAFMLDFCYEVNFKNSKKKHVLKPCNTTFQKVLFAVLATQHIIVNVNMLLNQNKHQYINVFKF